MAQHRGSAGRHEPRSAPFPLVEREAVLARIDEALRHGRDGHGQVVALHASAGHGKTRLLSEAERRAADQGYRVLRSRSTPLEVAFPFGAAMQLFEPVWLEAGADERQRLADGSAWRAGEWLDGRLDRSSEDDPYALIHALFRFARTLMEVDGSLVPLALFVDDAHWADESSLRLIAYLAQRIEQLPVVIIVAARAGHEATDPEALRTITSAPAAIAPEVPALSAAGVETVIRSRFPEAERSFVATCARLTSGNPLLLEQLLGHVIHEGHAPDGRTGEQLERLTPKAVIDRVVRRLSEMDKDAVDVARAVAILGEAVPVAQAAAVSGVSVKEVTRAGDALAASHLLRPGAPLAFVHPIIEAGVRESMPPLDRGRAHRRAAQVLVESGAMDERIATHLLLAPPEGERWAVDALRAAARRARGAGTPEVAIRFLERAVAEMAPAPPDPEIVAELAETAAAACHEGAVQQLRAAIGAVKTPRRRLELEVTLAKTLVGERRTAEAASVLSGAMDESGALAGPVRDEFDAALIDAARFEPQLASAAATRGRELIARSGAAPSFTQARVIAEMAFGHALDGGPAGRTRELADLAARARADAADDGMGAITRPLVAALVCADELEHALALSEQCQRSEGGDATRVRSGARALALLEQGRVSEALREAKGALVDRPTDWMRDFEACAAFTVLVRGSVLAGDVERADRAVRVLDRAENVAAGFVPCLLEARSRVRAAQLRVVDAIADAAAAGRMAEELALRSSPVVPWRSSMGFGLVALGELTRARELATEELTIAESIGAPRAILRALRCLALATGGRDGRSLLMRASEMAAGTPDRLEHVECLIALGATLRRGNQRAAAREPLERAVAAARRGGAHGLMQVALTELEATGARGRRSQEAGVASLTVSQRRVADLAVRGLTTREMSEVLYVTPKTVEYHLRQIYRKLGIASRAELAALLGE